MVAKAGGLQIYWCVFNILSGFADELDREIFFKKWEESKIAHCFFVETAGKVWSFTLLGNVWNENVYESLIFSQDTNGDFHYQNNWTIY